MALRDIWAFLGQIDPTTHKFVPTSWTVAHHPGTNVKATITKAASTHAKRHVATSITVVLAAGASAPTAAVVSVALIDGASGGGTYLWGPHDVAIPAVAGSMNGISIPIWAVGSASTAMTLEFSAAAGTNTYESVTLTGTSV